MRTPNPTTTPNSNSNSFSVLTYNVLAKSLATNMIPWVMKISNQSIVDRIVKLEEKEQYNTVNTNNEQEPYYYTLDKWINNKIKPEYMKHFHKNFDSGNYAQMRQLWSSPQLQNQNDIPIDLTTNNVKYVSEDCISYEKKKIKKEKDTTVEVVTETAKTLRGISKLHLTTSTTDSDSDSDSDPNLFDDFINDVMSRELTVFDWNNVDIGGRGSRLFQTIFSQNDSNPDIIALQEYDFHNEYITIIDVDDDDDDDDGNRDKATSTQTLTFADAMISKNYDGVFLKDPLLDRDPPSGLGLFWNTQIFESINNSESSSNDDDDESSSQGVEGRRNKGRRMEIIDCNTSGFNGSVSNYDLLEQWHPINKKQSSKKKTEESEATTKSLLIEKSVLLPSKDRRNVGICTLKHKGTNKIIKIVVTHLMTTSRDSTSTNLYPGEVRAGEIEKIKQLVCCSDGNKDDDDAAAAVIVLGDMNTNALDTEDANIVFGGTVPSSSSTKTTSTSSSKTTKSLQFDTGFDTTTSTFSWNDHILKDAFEKQHQWGKSTNDEGNNYCTSRNANRMEWIDYVFYDTQKLNLLETSDCQINQPIPDEINPSDHIPLYAKFEFM